MKETSRGIYDKFQVKRTDGRSEPGEKHYQCEYFVLDLKHDRYAGAALRAYAIVCKKEYPTLSHDLHAIADQLQEAPTADIE